MAGSQAGKAPRGTLTLMTSGVPRRLFQRSGFALFPRLTTGPRMRFLLTAGTLFLVGCSGRTATTASTTGGVAASAVTAPAPSRNPDVISEAEIALQRDVANAFDLIRRIRPNFLRAQERTSLRTTAAAALVRLNGQLLGEISELRGIEVSRIKEIRFYSIVQAESLFSGDRGRPVINVTTKS